LQGYMLYSLRKLGLSARVYEAGNNVGGTWYWNRYPGARCDVESMEYSYSFSDELQEEWHWTERYASQPEILRYINHVADRCDLRRDIQFETRVTSAVFNEAANGWNIQTDRGDRISAQFCIMATGCLSAAQVPAYRGLETFDGRWYHTGNWPQEGVDFTGQRVGVIGTGSSAIQSIPHIAEQAAHLFVFQRTPNFSIPAHNVSLDQQYEQTFKANFAEYRQLTRKSDTGFGIKVPGNNQSALEATPEERQQAYGTGWVRGAITFGRAFNDLSINREANETAAEFVRTKIRETVRDPTVAEKLLPRDYPFGTKRLCVDTNYYATFNRQNVTLVDIKSDPIVEITPKGLRTQDSIYELNSIVFATGYDAMTGALFKIDIRGRDGLTLKEKWADGPTTYLGIMPAGFPNLFIITGPGSPSVLSNMIVSIEQHVEWVAECISFLRQRAIKGIEANEEAENSWMAHVSEVASLTLYPQANSWYVGANIPGKPRIFMPYIGGLVAYRLKCDEVAAKDYEGFIQLV
jgi:cation diffusion facilitator CzcD-associated flavoprotein CzcO